MKLQHTVAQLPMLDLLLLDGSNMADWDFIAKTKIKLPL